MLSVNDLYHSFNLSAENTQDLYALIISSLMPIIKEEDRFSSLFDKIFGDEITRKDYQKFKQLLKSLNENKNTTDLVAFIDKHQDKICEQLQINSQNLNTEELYTKFSKKLNVNIRVLKNIENAEDYSDYLCPNEIITEYVERVPADGNCFFHGLANELNRLKLKQNITHLDVRAQGIEYLINHPQLLENFPPENETTEAYLFRMSSINSWAEGSIIEAVSLVFNLAIQIDDQREGIIISSMILNDKPDVLAKISLVRVENMHYDILRTDISIAHGPTITILNASSQVAALLIKQAAPEQSLALIKAHPAQADEATKNKLKKKFSFKNQENSSDHQSQFRDAIFEQFFYDSLGKIPNILQSLNKELPEKIVELEDPFLKKTLTRQKEAPFQLRYNSLQELAIIQTDMPLVTHRLNDSNIGSPLDITKKSLVSAGVGLCSSLAIIGASTLVEELAVGLGLMNFLPIAGPPILAVTLLSTLTVAGVGIPAALSYEKTLQRSRDLIEKKQYEDAAILLDKEFNRWFIAPFRYFFLTKQHYAIAHFFRGMCAENSLEYIKAYEEYDKATGDALQASRPLVALLSRLQKVKILKKHPLQLIMLNDHQQELKKIISEMTIHVPNAFFDYYENIQNSILGMTNSFISSTELTQEEINWTNIFLQIDSLFILSQFAKTRGPFLELFTVFFQGVILCFMLNTNLKYLQQNTANNYLNMLPNKTGLSKFKMLNFISHKFKDCINLIETFKINFNKEIERDAVLSSSLLFIENFIIHFSVINGLASEKNVKNINLLKCYSFTPEHKFKETKLQLEFTIDFLCMIYEEFNLEFYSIKECLEAIVRKEAQEITSVSKKTGKTMLHLLAQLDINFPELHSLLRTAAFVLKEQVFNRDNAHLTPFAYIPENDIYQLRTLLLPNAMIELGNQNQEIDKFIQKMQKNPKDSKHMLLLEGPPGTGKTDTVLTSFREKMFVIHEWQTGNDDDKYVGQLQARIIEFFANIKKDAKKSSSKMHIIFMDEIEAVCGEANKDVDPRFFNHQIVTAEFQKQINGLSGYTNVIVVGATNYPKKIADAILSRAHRILYPLPDYEQRIKILKHFFIEKSISNQHIERLASLTPGWSIRSLIDLKCSIESTKISEEDLDQALKNSTKIFENTFKKEFKCASISLPIFKNTPIDNSVFSIISLPQKAQEQFSRLAVSLQNPNLYSKRLHTLLFGPPGGGKTTAIRNFAKNANITFILIEAGVQYYEMVRILDQAKQFSPAIVFIDEFDQIGHIQSPFRELLQEKMDGYAQDNIVFIGATNFPEKIAEPLMSRFAAKIEIPQLKPSQIAQFIKLRIIDEGKELSGIYSDSLQIELEKNCENLAEFCKGMSLRNISIIFSIIFGDFKHQRSQKSSGGLLLSLEKIKEQIRNFSSDIPTKASSQGFFASNSNSHEEFVKDFMSKFSK